MEELKIKLVHWAVAVPAAWMMAALPSCERHPHQNQQYRRRHYRRRYRHDGRRCQPRYCRRAQCRGRRRPPHHRLRYQRRNQPAETACPFGYRSQPDGKTLGNRRIRPNRHTGASHHLGRPSEPRPYRQRVVSRHSQPALRAGRRLCRRDGERRRPRPPVEHAGLKQHRRVRKQRQNHAHRAGKRPV